jgi:UDP-N-acetylmuramate-alanine ligase
MNIIYEDRSEKIPEALLDAENRSSVLVIYTPAVPRHTAIVQTFTTAGLRIFKRAEVLGLLSQGHKTFAVAGTHGKTTTSTLLAHILKVAGVDKSKRTKILDKELENEEHEKVQGGYGRYQGTWQALLDSCLGYLWKEHD